MSSQQTPRSKLFPVYRLIRTKHITLFLFIMPGDPDIDFSFYIHFDYTSKPMWWNVFQLLHGNDEGWEFEFLKKYILE